MLLIAGFSSTFCQKVGGLNKMFDAMVPCKACNNKVPASSLKMDLDIGKMVCPDCIKNKKIHKEIEQGAFHKEQKEGSMMHAGNKLVQAEEPQPSKMGHKCNSCGYKFKIDLETKKPKNCPYCNARVMGI